ncbi:uncharacterized protein LOC128679582 isoform X2 [Plodia interpunctella]|uniref:uncharacterized protein LOC128679582 isoform X2 n=1 Tax=Plodia interpunctella TaxID=58824 RepID=UPI002367EFB5|nr:uncharacterized protein LOC128679582 isoform X2 [Plodia interpunctella]
MNIMSKAKILIVNILFVSTFSFDIRKVSVKIDYNKTKTIVQNSLNEVVNLLHIEVPVSRKPKMRLLVVMQNNLNNIVHYKWKVHSEMQYIARAESIVVPEKLYEYVTSAIIDMEKENRNNQTVKNNTNTYVSSDFFSEVLNAINSQNVTEVGDVDTNIDGQDKDTNRRKMDDDDLDIWEPDAELENSGRRLYGGKRVGIRRYPFIVSIHVLGKFKGTGCIINRNFVITAASCLLPTVYTAAESPIQIRIGSEFATSGGELLPAEAVVFHPRFDSVSMDNNLAIVKVKNVFNSEMRPIIKKIRIGSLPGHLPKNFANKGVFVLGWRIDPNDTLTPYKLSSAFLDMNSLDMCMNVYTTRLMDAKHFCAGLVYKGNGACNGDMGSPAIVLGSLVGLVNFGPQTCGTSPSPTVFTKLSYYTSWINDVVKEDPVSIPFHYKSKIPEQSNNNFNKNQNSPEEILLLRQLIHEIDKPNNDLADNIEDNEVEDEMKVLFQTTPTNFIDAAHHSLVNKSVLLVPGVHIKEYVTEATHVAVTPYVTQSIIDIGLPTNLPYQEIDSVVKNSDELRYYIHDILTNGNTILADEVEKYVGIDLGLRTQQKKKREKKSVETDSNDNFEYDSYEGLSIEVKKKAQDLLNKAQIKANNNAQLASLQQSSVLDLGDHNVQLDMKVNKDMRFSIRPSEMWSEAMRIKKIYHDKSKFRKGYMKLNGEPKRFRSIHVPNAPWG